jgi:hypothetical protein
MSATMVPPELGSNVVNDLLLLFQMTFQKQCNCKQQQVQCIATINPRQLCGVVDLGFKPRLSMVAVLDL